MQKRVIGLIVLFVAAALLLFVEINFGKKTIFIQKPFEGKVGRIDECYAGGQNTYQVYFYGSDYGLQTYFFGANGTELSLYSSESKRSVIDFNGYGCREVSQLPFNIEWT